MKKTNWNIDNIPDQKGKQVIVTGATSGLGKETTRVLALKGASIIMAVRNLDKGEKVKKEILKETPAAEIVVSKLDLTSLVSIKEFADKINRDYQQLHLLINNAGVMMCPYSKTKDGFEMQMGTNHLGHFALTGHLLALLKKTANSRIVNLASIAHKGGKINLSDINWEKRKYKTIQAYGDSKIANLYFTYELAEKLKDVNAPLVVAAHPGWTYTDLGRHQGLFSFLSPFFGQKVEMGSLPTLRAACDPAVVSGDYYGPSNLFEIRGYPKKVKSNRLSHDKKIAKELWKLSEEMMGVKY